MSLLHAVGGAVEDKLYPEDAFVSYVRTGTGVDTTVTTNIDMTKGYMVWTKGRSGATNHAIYDSARGVTKDLVTNSTAAETTQTTGLKSVSTTGHTIGSLAKMNTSGATYVDWVFKKAPKFFDVVIYTGDDVAGRQIAHSLGVEPGMIIIKRTNADGRWAVWHRSVGGRLALNTIQAYDYSNTDIAGGAVTSASATMFGGFEITSYTNLLSVNANGGQYVAYLFATLPSISKVGSYTGNGTTQTIPCGFSTGSRFVLIKRTDSTGDWYIWDTVRGIVAGNDPHLSLNTTSAEVTTDDSIDPESSGFIVNQNTATNINVNGGSYIFLAIA